MKKLLYIFFVYTSITVTWAYLIPHHIYTTENLHGFGPDYKNNISIKIKRYPIPRTTYWSGIFPFYGGFVPDPHILYSPVKPLAKKLLQNLQLKNGRVQGYAINPFFDKKYYELILALELEDTIYPLSIALNNKKATFQVGGENTIFPFLLEDKLCFYINDNEEFLILTEYSKNNKTFEALKDHKLYEKDTEGWTDTIRKLKKEKDIHYFLEDLLSSRNKFTIALGETLKK
ncbi:hypothetical protein PGH07_01920 [Sulfurovum sp. zt1-1]|uniref:Uncharacterized protein n=1 Tax=Sulfurovum zhangzhouensis TaxID=3019067 RepID=A0ABT7QW14_9BACT|nr:hypothetical protein [Sulfurovum zhangzhouensis]MDM5270931.1 hypothetical protein [Sulfurovum zhangzhouensis]